MLLILGGVQASGKTTIQKAIGDNFNNVKMLERSENLRNALLESPRDIGTSNHINVLNKILEAWEEILTSSYDDPKTLWVLDAGPITTLTYNALTLEYFLLKPENWEHYMDVQNRIESPHTKYLEKLEIIALRNDAMQIMANWFQKVFSNVIRNHGRVHGIHLVSEADAIRQRFVERRNDIRSHNMQDWFRNKEDEIETYKWSYGISSSWVDRKAYTHCQVSTSGNVDDTLRDVYSSIETIFGL